jgi:hypothetical protein
MTQGATISSIVSDFKKDPRNKIVIFCADLCSYASEELGTDLSPESLAKAVTAFKDGEATESDERIVDAATSLFANKSQTAAGAIAKMMREMNGVRSTYRLSGRILTPMSHLTSSSPSIKIEVSLASSV